MINTLDTTIGLGAALMFVAPFRRTVWSFASWCIGFFIVLAMMRGFRRYRAGPPA